MYFIKLFTELLDDIDLGMLSDNLWRRMVELSLMAAELDQDGQLPPVNQIAWRLRLQVEQLENELFKLKDANFLTLNTDGVWIVAEYEKMTGPISATERRRQSYKRKKQEDKSMVTRRQNVTKTSRNVTKHATELELESDITTTTIAPENFHFQPDTDFAKICRCWEENIGSLSPVITDNLRTYSLECQPGWIESAIKEAVENGVTKWAYIRSILDSWIQAGKITDKPKKASRNGRKQQRSNQPTNPAGASDANQPGYLLDQLPSVNIYTGEIVPPVDPR